MESALPLDVPLTVDIKVGDDWDTMTPLTRADAIAAEADEAPDLETPDRARHRVGFAPCLNFPRSRPSRATCARASSAPRSSARVLVGADAADPHARGLRRGDRRPTVEAVGRRAKLVVVELSGDAALTIHLKMTGQLFVVPADAPEDPYVRLVLELEDGRELRFRDIRKFGRVGPVRTRPGDAASWSTRSAGPPSSPPFGPEPLDPAFDVKDFRRGLRRRKGRLKPLLLDQSFLAGVGNIYADEALWTARLHPLRSASSLRPPDERHLYEAIRTILAEAVERRGSSIDDYTAPDGDGSMQERLQVYQRTGEPCPRCGRPIKRIVVGARSTHFCSWCQRLSAADRAAAKAILRTQTGGDVRRGRRWTELAGEGSLGLTTDEAERAARPDRTERTKRAAATRRAAARDSMGAGPMSILRLTGVTREIGTFVILDGIDASIALGDRIGLVGPNGAGKTTLLRIAAGRAEPDTGEVHRKRGLTVGLLAQEAHFDEAFMASRDAAAGRPDRCGAPGPDGRGARRRSSATAGSWSRPTPTCCTGTRSSAATPWTSASTRR